MAVLLTLVMVVQEDLEVVVMQKVDQLLVVQFKVVKVEIQEHMDLVMLVEQVQLLRELVVEVVVLVVPVVLAQVQ